MVDLLANASYFRHNNKIGAEALDFVYYPALSDDEV